MTNKEKELMASLEKCFLSLGDLIEFLEDEGFGQFGPNDLVNEAKKAYDEVCAGPWYEHGEITPAEQAAFDRAWDRLADRLGFTAEDIAEIKAKFEPTPVEVFECGDLMAVRMFNALGEMLVQFEANEQYDEEDAAVIESARQTYNSAAELNIFAQEVTPVEVEEVMDEDDFVQAGIVAREVLKKTAKESAQEWIDNNPEWVDSFSDFVASKSGQVTEE